MIDYSNIINGAKRSCRLIAVIYAFLKIGFYMVIASEDVLIRVIGSIVMITIVFLMTRSRLNLSKRQLAAFLPITVAMIEIIIVIQCDGDRLTYIFLMGCALLSLLYVDVIGLLIAQVSMLTITAVTIILPDITILGPNYSLDDDIFNISGMIMMYIVLFLLGRYSINTLHRSHQTGIIFDKIIENTPNFMIVTNEETEVTHISESLLKWLELDNKSHALGKPLLDLFTSMDMKRMFHEVMSSNGFVEREFELYIERRRCWFILRSELLGESRAARFYEFIDITPVVEARIAAETANRSKTNFLTTMSHEIRTPLNAIIGISQIQLQHKYIPQDCTDAFESIYTSGNSLLGIINDILDMSKVEAGKLDLNVMQYHVPRLINDVIQLNMIRIGSKPIEFILDIEENLPSRLFGDEIRIKQILNNLLSNAIKYTEKGFVKLLIRHWAQDELIVLHFVVEDSGQGIKPEDRERLFKQEYLRLNIEANYSTEGTGIGLTITKRLTDMMDGSISVQSEYGKGSAFTVIIKQGYVDCPPIGAAIAKQLCEFSFSGSELDDKAPVISQSMPHGSVLVVDDLATNLYVVKGLLSVYDLDIETANSGFQVIEKIESGAVYDIIFMDHMMPKMNGIETTKKLRANGYKGAIVALTANALVGNDAMFAANGFDGFISKPIDIQLLDEILNKFIS